MVHTHECGPRVLSHVGGRCGRGAASAVDCVIYVLLVIKVGCTGVDSGALAQRIIIAS